MIEALRSRKVQIAGQAVVITALVGGTAAFVGLNKSVTLTVDGESREVRTFANSVSDVLDAQEVVVEKGDVVQPAESAAVTRDMDIVVNTLKDVTLTVDGITSEEETTANTVGQALADLGVDAEGAEVSHALDDSIAGGSAAADIDVVTPKTVTVIADGARTPVEATAATTADVLAQAGVELGESDAVSAPLTAPAVDGGVLEVLRTEVKDETAEESIKKKVTERKDGDLPRGERKVITEGKDGKKEVTYTVTTVNGQVVTREKKTEKVISEATDEVVAIGTKAPQPKPAPAPRGGGSGGGSGSGSGGSGSGSGGGGEDIPPEGTKMSTEDIKKMLGGPGTRWYKIVKCESNFNPRAVNQQNRAHFGLFQFKLATWRSVGGSGNPIDASPQEQFKRAKILQAKAGWGQWSCA